MLARPCLLSALVSWTYRAPPVVATNLTANGLECTFAVNQLEFDLCPLLNAHTAPFDVTQAEETPPTYTKNVYAVSLAGPLRRDGTLPAELQCPEGTRICLTVVNTRPNHPSEPSRILQVIPVAGKDLKPKAKLGSKERESDHHAPLQVTLHGGSYMQQRQKATFLFYCDHSIEEPTMPTFTWRFNGTHAFSWRTKYACHKPLSAPQPDPDPDPDPPQEPPTDPESDHNDSPPTPRISGFRIFWLAVLTLLIARLVLFLLRRRRYQFLHPSSSLPSPITHQIRPFLSMRFIPRSLYAGKEELDNRPSTALYHPAYPDMDDNEGEEVPLTPSPSGTYSRSPQSPAHYGSF